MWEEVQMGEPGSGKAGETWGLISHLSGEFCLSWLSRLVCSWAHVINCWCFVCILQDHGFHSYVALCGGVPSVEAT